ncbi:MAG: phenylacetate-CoA oxygenase subunit PaaJ [Chitinophaga sp.]|uniref:1,2-phenylacetyl-CoA epoxidase subunit PaaD n=1 Tax=Chitinophaga sp. TaxID=1869181 RepID=UPI001B187BE3|nr:1,2-phenylacetyl-CoA epoxidase subunit PaaD [Chitinophaga sp.]MBO9727127.1 phenylacetate-CoA oxygenase subunit PaaJ [Chitinophaga sp.]
MSHKITIAAVYESLEHVMDPEIPVLSVIDLGMITEVDLGDAGVHVKMIPTFAACPAVSYIQHNIKTTLENELGVHVSVEVDKQVHWQSNRMTPAAKEKLKNFGIAPPKVLTGEVNTEIMLEVPCPHCGSEQTYLRSPFGSTLCRAIHFCKACGQVFEQFKPLE